MSAPIFVDTNILVYALDAGAGDKQRQAAAWMELIWRSGRGRLSTQVLHEFYVTVTQKLRPGLPRPEAQAEGRGLQAWRPVALDESVLERAWTVEQRLGLSLWDSLIVAAAQASGCGHLLTEDLQDGQQLDGVQVLNPFRHQPDTVGLEAASLLKAES
jgi:predicted nucleic acid-binding protein